MTQALIDQFPAERLTPEREADLASRAHKGDEDAANELVLGVMREALRYTQRVSHDKISEADRVSLCYRKLMMCVPKFDPTRGLRFFPFCKAGLRGYMKNYWEGLNVVRNATEIVSVDVLDGWRGTHNRDKRQAKRPLQGRENPIPPAIEDECPGPSRERITHEITSSGIEDICTRDQWEDIKSLAFEKLTEQQRTVLSLVYESGLNYTEIGKLFDRTRSLIHAVHREAIKVLRAVALDSGRTFTEQ